MKQLHSFSFIAAMFLIGSILLSGNLIAQDTKPDESDTSRSTYMKEFDFIFNDNQLDGNNNPSESTENFKTVTIGNQIWMAENLNVTTFRNGDAITEVTDKMDWWLGGTSPAWCFYNNDADNGQKYGRLYNLAAINDTRGLAPAGWHIATEAEWKVLLNTLGDEAFKKLKSTDSWKEGNNGSNESKFAALPGGCRDNHGEFKALTETAYWWSLSKSISGDGGMAFFIRYYMYAVDNDVFDNYGFSVRCVKD
jgi:uncharacterized protein (TIGR02145 family)